MVTIEMLFTFSRGTEDKMEVAEFEADSGLTANCDVFAEEFATKLNADFAESDEKWTLIGCEVNGFDSDYADPMYFDNLDEYGAYIEKCIEYGEAYVLRYDSVGDHNFRDEYQGCWRTEEEFAEDLFEQLNKIPDNIRNYIDWEAVTRDVMMDFNVYEGREGLHIFSN